MNDKFFHITGGIQQIMSFNGYVVPLVVQARLARLHIRAYTDNEWDSLPHLILTSADEWVTVHSLRLKYLMELYKIS